MTMTEQEIMETPIAELSQWGLSERTVNMLETRFGFIYVWELRGVERDQLLEGEDVGMAIVLELVNALGAFLTEAPNLVME